MGDVGFTSLTILPQMRRIGYGEGRANTSAFLLRQITAQLAEQTVQAGLDQLGVLLFVLAGNLMRAAGRMKFLLGGSFGLMLFGHKAGYRPMD